MSVCDKRCEACQYPDCVNDAMDLDDYREADARDRALGTVRKTKDPPPVGGDAAKKEAARERARERAREGDQGILPKMARRAPGRAEGILQAKSGARAGESEGL